MGFLKAMAMGRCVIAPNTPTMNEYIEDGINGFLYDLRNLSPLKIENVREIQKNAENYKYHRLKKPVNRNFCVYCLYHEMVGRGY